jgi:hypothetical protein
MKEFGVYTLNQEYSKEFLGVENKLASMKPGSRPFVCVKIKVKGENDLQNWLIPLTSIDPAKNDYCHKRRKYETFNAEDKKHQPHAMDIFSNLVDNSSANSKSVALYFDALPVKHKYCKKYFVENKHHVIDEKVGLKLRFKLKEYLKSYMSEPVSSKKGRVGFLKHYAEAHPDEFRDYPVRCIELLQALYKNHLETQKNKGETKKSHTEREAAISHKKELKKIAASTYIINA